MPNDKFEVIGSADDASDNITSTPIGIRPADSAAPYPPGTNGNVLPAPAARGTHVAAGGGVPAPTRATPPPP